MLFFHVKSAAEARALLDRPPPALDMHAVPLAESVGRVLAAPVYFPSDLPAFDRAVVDGYAVRAADTFGASASQPAYLKLAGEVLMGAQAGGARAGEAVRIATGGMLPAGADAVVMLEHASPAGGGLVEVMRPAAPGDGLVRAGDDARAGDLLAPRGRRLRPQDVGALAGAGILSVVVFRRPRAAVIPTGDELVPPETAPGPGQVRDVNSAALSAALLDAGVDPLAHPIVVDDPGALRSAVAWGLEAADLVLVGGGSSVGARDWTLETFLAFPGAELLIHGVGIRPGKPVIVVGLGTRLLVGLPGNPVSALVVLDRLLRPYLRRLTGEECRLPGGGSLPARMARNCASEPGREDYVRVRLEEGPDGWLAVPLLGKSALLRTLVEADGLVVVPAGAEGVEAGEAVEVLLF